MKKNGNQGGSRSKNTKTWTLFPKVQGLPYIPRYKHHKKTWWSYPSFSALKMMLKTSQKMVHWSKKLWRHKGGKSEKTAVMRPHVLWILSFSLMLEGEETWWFINRSINEDLKRHTRKNNETLRAGPASKLNLARHFWSWYSLLRKQLLSHHQRFTVVEQLSKPFLLVA